MRNWTRVEWMRIIISGGVCALMMFMIVVFCSPMALWEWAAGGLASLTAGMVVLQGLFQHEENLAKRIRDGESVLLGVIIEGKTVGRISDADLARLEWNALTSPWIWIDQIGNSISVLRRFLWMLMLAVPFLLFCLVALMFLVQPSAGYQLLHLAMHASSPALEKFARPLLSFSSALGLAYGVPLLVFRPSALGIKDCFQLAVMGVIRGRVGAADAQAPIVLLAQSHAEYFGEGVENG